MSRNHDKLFELNTFQKIFLLSNYLKESKPQKNWFANKFNECMSNIRNDVDFITKERRLEHLKKKYKGNSFSNKKNTIFIDINKFNHRFNSKGNKYYLKKISSKKMINSLDNIEENENNISNSNNIEHNYEQNNNFVYNFRFISFWSKRTYKRSSGYDGLLYPDKPELQHQKDRSKS